MKHENNNLAGFLEGSLSEPVRSRVEKHLETCGHCRSALADMRAAGRALRAAGESHRVPPQAPELWSRVHAQIARPEPRPILRPRWAYAAGGLALACTIVWNFAANNALVDSPTLITESQPKQSVPIIPPKVAPPASKTQIAEAPAAARSERREKLPVPAYNPIPVPQEFADKTPATNPGITGRPSDLMKKERLTRASDSDIPPSHGLLMRPPAAGKPAPPMLEGFDTSEKDKMAASPAAAPAVAPDTTVYDSAGAASKANPAPVASRITDNNKTEAGNTVGLEIISDEPPPMPGPLGVRGQVGERSMMAKGNMSSGAPRAGAGAPMWRFNEIVTGTPTLEGSRLLAKADAEFARGKNEAATLYYDGAVKAGLDSGQIRLVNIKRGDMALQANDTAAAIRHYLAALANTKDAGTFTKLGDAYEKAGNAKEALAAYKNALSISPQYAPAKEGQKRLLQTGK